MSDGLLDDLNSACKLNMTASKPKLSAGPTTCSEPFYT